MVELGVLKSFRTRKTLFDERFNERCTLNEWFRARIINNTILLVG